MTTQPPLRRIRWFVWAVLALAMLVSILANMLHAEPRLISRLIAMWPPIALLLTIELVTRVPLYRRAVAYVRRIATVSVALIAAWVSYWHMVGVAERYGETGLSVFVLPLSVDGLVVVASVCLVEVNGKLRDKPADTPVEAKKSKQALAPNDRQVAPSLGAKPARVPDRRPSVTQAVRDAKAIHGDNRAAVVAMVRDIYPDVSDDTLRKSLARTNGHAHA